MKTNFNYHHPNERVKPLCFRCFAKAKAERGAEALYYLGPNEFEQCASCAKRIHQSELIWTDA
jgi:hypothetical protein